MAGDVVYKQLIAVIDERTTVLCLTCAGQVRPVDQPFDTIDGPKDEPPFHWHCRSFVVPWMDGAGDDLAAEAKAELKDRDPEKIRWSKQVLSKDDVAVQLAQNPLPEEQKQTLGSLTPRPDLRVTRRSDAPRLPEAESPATPWVQEFLRLTARRSQRVQELIDQGVPHGQTSRDPEVDRLVREINAVSRRISFDDNGGRRDPEEIERAMRKEQARLKRLGLWHEYGAGQTQEEFESEAIEHLQRLMDDSTVNIRVSPKALESILTDPDRRVKTQFETDTSKALKSNERRSIVESALWGYDRDLPDEDRVIYGYVQTGGQRASGQNKGWLHDETDDALSMYGKIQLVLRPEVRQRTTVMIGDTIDSTGALASPMTDLDEAVLGNLFPHHEVEVDDNGTVGDYSVTGGVLSAGLRRNPVTFDPTDPKFRELAYVEAQIHGQVSLDDVEKVILPARMGKLVKLLDELGIPWEVMK